LFKTSDVSDSVTFKITENKLKLEVKAGENVERSGIVDNVSLT